MTDQQPIPRHEPTIPEWTRYSWLWPWYEFGYSYEPIEDEL